MSYDLIFRKSVLNPVTIQVLERFITIGPSDVLGKTDVKVTLFMFFPFLLL